MLVTTEITSSELKDYLWSGAINTLNDLTDDEIEQILGILEDVYFEEPMSITSLNDFFWFETDTIAEWLGYDDYEELLNRDKIFE